MVLGKNKEKSSGLFSGLEKGVSAPEVLGKTALGDGFLSGTRYSRKKKVKSSEKAIEIDKSNKAFDELKMNGVRVFLLNDQNEVIGTTSKMCGEGEYMFTFAEGIVRVWRGGTSVFEDGDPTILFHRPHLAVDVSKGDKHLILVTQIREFDFGKIYRILTSFDKTGN